MRLLVLFLFVIFVVSCGTDDQDNAQVAYAVKNQYVPHSVLKDLHKPEFRICYTGKPEAKALYNLEWIEHAYAEWTGAIAPIAVAPLAPLKIVDDSVEPCTDVHLIVEAANTGKSSKFVGPLGQIGKITNQINSMGTARNALLHEMGHAFAQGDHACKSGATAGEGIMCSVSYNAVQADDIKGVQIAYSMLWIDNQPK